MSSVFITGCSRGLGLELVKQLLVHSNPPRALIATCRKPNDSAELLALAKQHSNLFVLKFDVLQFDSYENLALKVKDIVGEKGLNVLINNAGILKDRKNVISDVTVEDFSETFLTNSIAPVMLIKAFRPLLKLAADSNQDSPMGWSRAAIINISSSLGSLTDNTTGGMLAYRESKAALNMSARSLEVELRPENVLILSMHPGWVQTDMGTSAAPLKVQDSVSGMLNVFYALKPEQHGSFHQWDGQVVPW